MRRRAYLYFTLTFLLGLVLGGLGVFLYGWYGGRWRRPFDHQRVVQQVTHDLNLNPTQAQELGQIIDESSKRYQALHEQTKPQFDALRQQTDDRIRQILTPEQAAKFNALIEKLRQERMRRTRRP